MIAFLPRGGPYAVVHRGSRCLTNRFNFWPLSGVFRLGARFQPSEGKRKLRARHKARCAAADDPSATLVCLSRAEVLALMLA
jgi:hypothetical protein